MDSISALDVLDQDLMELLGDVFDANCSEDYTSEESSVTSSEDQSSVNSSEVANSTSKNARVSVPRILRRDIRRTYANMFVNSINSGQPDMIARFITRFCTPYASSCFSHPDGDELKVMPNFEVSGSSGIYAMFCAQLLQHPDLVIHMRTSKVVTSPESPGGVVVATCNGFGTKMYDIDMGGIPNIRFTSDAVSNIFTQIDKPFITGGNIHEYHTIGTKRKSSAIPDRDLNLENGICQAPQTGVHSSGQHNLMYPNLRPKLLPKPHLALTCSTTFVMHLSEEKYIERLEIVSAMSLAPKRTAQQRHSIYNIMP